MNDHDKLLSEVPLMIIILFSLAGGMAGEMFRAEKDGVTGMGLLRRIILRAGASTMFGMSTILLAYEAGASFLAACAIGCIVGTQGADVATGIYNKYLAKRFERCNQSSDGDK